MNLYLTGNLGIGAGGESGGIVGVTLNVALFTVTMISPLKDSLQAFTQLKTSISASARVGTVLSANSELIGNTKWARGAGLFFDIALPWGLALYDIYSNDLKPDSIAFNRAIAGAVAGTIVAIMFFALNATVIGTLISVVIAFIDGFLQLLCSAGVSGTCWGIASSVTNALVTLAYDGDSTIDMNPRDSSGQPNLMQINDIDSGLVDPNLGMRVGNGIYYRARITTNLQHKFRHLDFYSADRFFSENDLRESTFRYILTTNPNTPYPKVERNQMPDEWKDVIRLNGYRG
jgi:hypothetical protein